ncbi:MAG: carbohydrate ABC transporter permease [Lachnospiraceae bacterium]|nr:carbohydrate ABC transporter permease [Lachnospiraceae bacterium]
MFVKRNKNRIKDTAGDKALHIFSTVVLILVIIVVGYPILYVLSSSVSDSAALSSGRVTVFPMVFDAESATYSLGLDFSGYKFVFSYDAVIKGFLNSLLYTVLGTSISITMIILMAYPLSKMDFQGRKPISKMLVFAMLINPGMVPIYLLKTSLGLNGTIWAVVLSGALNITHVFIMRTSFKNSIPGELFDAAKLDGANDFQCLVRIAVPLAKATVSVLMLYAAVHYWNNYFNAMLYLADRQDLWPLPLVLRNFLISSKEISSGGMSAAQQEAFAKSGIYQIQFCLIVVATVPVLALYSFVQRFFEKGVMIGSVKG